MSKIEFTGFTWSVIGYSVLNRDMISEEIKALLNHLGSE